MAPFLNRELRRLFGAGAQNLAICREMADAFGARYGVSFTPFHNVVDAAQWDQPKVDYAWRDTFRVVYTLYFPMPSPRRRDPFSVFDDFWGERTGLKELEFPLLTQGGLQVRCSFGGNR